MGIAQEKGYRIPEDISFIGFTDGLLSKYSKPRLTSINQNGDKMGEIAAEMLINKVETTYDEENDEAEEVFQTKVIKASLIEREST